MTVETDLIALKLQVRDLEDRLKYLYTHLNITYVESAEAGDAKITEMLKRGNKIEAIKIYREMFNVGLAEAKEAVEGMETRLGL
ncbi:MAG TPA: ribosomal protein L7/L12 [Anaerolineales bacterium]|nr:ribosomal protein L7/L12 [Anaerolineales bacterium]